MKNGRHIAGLVDQSIPSTMDQLQKVEAELQRLQDQLQKVEAEIQRVQDEISDCESQLNRALELSEKRRLSVKAENLRDEKRQLRDEKLQIREERLLLLRKASASSPPPDSGC